MDLVTLVLLLSLVAVLVPCVIVTAFLLVVIGKGMQPRVPALHQFERRMRISASEFAGIVERPSAPRHDYDLEGLTVKLLGGEATEEMQIRLDASTLVVDGRPVPLHTIEAIGVELHAGTHPQWDAFARNEPRVELRISARLLAVVDGDLRSLVDHRLHDDGSGSAVMYWLCERVEEAMAGALAPEPEAVPAGLQALRQPEKG